MTETTGYTRLQLALHWGVALLILFNWLTGESVGQPFDAMLESGTAPASTPLHVYVGLAVFFLVLIRLVVRLVQGAPGAEPGLQGMAAAWVHRILYLLMLAVPFIGGLAWYRGVEEAGDLHGLVANLLILLAGLHAVIALGHHFILRDGILMRMLRPR